MKSCLWYSYCRLYKNKMVTLITTGMLAVGLVLVCYAASSYLKYHKSELMAEKTVEYNLDNIYNINFFKYIYAGNSEKWALKELYNYIKDISEIEFCGMYFYIEDALYITPELAEMCGISIKAANDEYSVWVGDNKAKTYLIGSSVPDINTEKKGTVVGVIDRGSVFLGDDYVNSLGKVICLDDYFVYDVDELLEIDVEYITNGIVNNFYIYISDSSELEAVAAKIKEKADMLGIDIYGINSMSDMLKSYSREVMKQAGEQYYMPIALFICSFVGMLIASMISYILNRHDTDIMLINGYTRKNLSAIFLLENTYKTAVAYLICFLYWKRDGQAQEYAASSDIDFAMIFTVVVALVLIVVSSLPSIGKIYIKTPTELLGEE